MKNKIILIAVFINVFMAASVFAYDATGIWNYTEHSASNNCGIQYTPESGEVIILQNGSSFLIVEEDDFSTYGNVSGNTYTYTDTFCEDEGYVILNATITLTTETSGTGSVSWTYYEDGSAYCSGSHQITLSKQSQTAPVYEASGKWNFTQSSFSTNCGSSSPPDSSGYITVTQSGTEIDAIDNKGREYTGYVNGTKYVLVRSYLDSGGRTTEWHIITLTSESDGSGQSNFVWDDDCDDCSADWYISVIKDNYTITATSTAGGVISPSGNITVDSGTSKLFQITPDSGYIISDVLVDDISVGAVSSYNFPDVTDDHSIHAIFSLNLALCESIKTQDFESGSVPPSGWQLIKTNQDYTWQTSTSLPHTGTYAAEVLYDPQLVLQDEILLSPRLSIKEAILHFWSNGSIYWCRDTYDNCDLEIWLVVGTWDAGTDDDIFIGKADDDWVGNFEWADSSFNLTSMLPDDSIRIGFRYKGTDGAQIAIDDIQICSDKPASKFLPFLQLLME